MKLISLSMKNFMPYKGEQEIAFPQDSSRNVMVIFGDNMRGKTSLLNAVRWVFYGRALGRHLREIELHHLLNSEAALEGDWEMEVSVQFKADGHHYDLRRRSTKKTLVATPSKSEDFDTIVALLKDGLAVNGNLIEAEINKFVPEQVSRFFLFDGELLQEYEALLIEGSEQGKNIKVAIEQVLGVPALIHGRDESSALLRKAQKQQSQDLAHVAGMERQADQQANLQAKQDAFEKDFASLREKLAETKVERTGLDDELEKTEAVQLAKARLDALGQRQREIVESLKTKQEEKLELLGKAWKDLLQPKLKAKRESLREEQQRVTSLIGKRSSLDTRIETIRKLLATNTCPTCEQSIGEERKAIAGNELGTLEGEIRDLAVDQNALTSVSAEMNAIDKLIVAPVGPVIRRIEVEMRKLDVDLIKAENDTEALTEEIKGFDTAEVARKRALRDQILKNESALERDIQLTQTNIEKVKKDLAIVAKTIQGMPQARAQRSTAAVNFLIKLEKVFSESIERLRDNLRHHVETKATDAFRHMTTQKAYRGLSINKNYGLTILDEHGRPVSLRSAGAEQIVALSLIDGLSRTGRAAGPVVMDTPFGRLDLKHRDNILRYLPTVAGQLVLLVHEGEIRKDTDLVPIAPRIGAAYEIREVNPRHSVIERVAA